jgi:hypothetical protein
VRNYSGSESVGRIDKIVVFGALTLQQTSEVAWLLLERIKSGLRAQYVNVEPTGEAVDLLAEEGFDPEFGARPSGRAILRRVGSGLANVVLSSSPSSNDEALVDVEECRFTLGIVADTAAVASDVRGVTVMGMREVASTQPRKLTLGLLIVWSPSTPTSTTGRAARWSSCRTRW